MDKDEAWLPGRDLTDHERQVIRRKVPLALRGFANDDYAFRNLEFRFRGPEFGGQYRDVRFGRRDKP